MITGNNYDTLNKYLESNSHITNKIPPNSRFKREKIQQKHHQKSCENVYQTLQERKEKKISIYSRSRTTQKDLGQWTQYYDPSGTLLN